MPDDEDREIGRRVVGAQRPSGAPQCRHSGTTRRKPWKACVWPQAGQRPHSPRPIAVGSGGTGQGKAGFASRAGCQRIGREWGTELYPWQTELEAAFETSGWCGAVKDAEWRTKQG